MTPSPHFPPLVSGTRGTPQAPSAVPRAHLREARDAALRLDFLMEHAHAANDVLFEAIRSAHRSGASEQQIIDQTGIDDALVSGALLNVQPIAYTIPTHGNYR